MTITIKSLIKCKTIDNKVSSLIMWGLLIESFMLRYLNL